MEVTITTPVVKLPRNPKVSFSRQDTATCRHFCWNPEISAIVSGLDPDEKIDLQLTYQITNPSFLVNEKKYITLDNVGNGVYPITPEMFGVECLWPGEPHKWPSDYTGEKVVTIYFA